MLPENPTPVDESTLFPPRTPVVEAGIIGWDGDDDQADVGTEDNSGVTLVKVQLFRGKDPHADVKPGVAQGTRILARLNGWPLWAIPPRGLQCYVIFPDGYGTSPGMGVLAAVPGPNPYTQFSTTRAKLDVGPDQDLVLKARSVTLSTYDNDYIVVGPDSGIRLADRNGNSILLKNGMVRISIVDGDPPEGKVVLQLSLDDLRMAHKNAAGEKSMIKLKGGSATMAADKEGAIATGAVMLGGSASPATPVMLGPPPGVPSTSIFGQ